MKTIKNVSPVGALSIPSLGRVLEHGDTIAVDDEVAASLLEQSDNFILVKTAAKPERPTEPDAASAASETTTAGEN